MAFNMEVSVMNINDFSGGINDPRLRDAIQKIGNSPEGQRFLNSITQQDKENLLRKFKTMNANGITSEMLIKQLNNPNIINQLNNIIKR